MAEILIVRRDAPQARLLGAALNAKGWACTPEYLNRAARPILDRVDPAVTVLVFRPGDEDQDREQVGQWLQASGQIIGWLLVPEVEIDQAIDQLRGIIGHREITWFSADSPVDEIAALTMTLARTGRPTRARATNARKITERMRLATARCIVASLRVLLPRMSLTDRKADGQISSMSNVLDELLGRARLYWLARAHVANLEQLAGETGPSETRLRRMARSARARVWQAAGSDHIVLVSDIARGDARAIARLMPERPIANLVELSQRALKRDGIQPTPALKAARAMIRKLLKSAAQEMRGNETSSADLVGIVIWETIRKFRRLRGARELAELDESQVGPDNGSDLEERGQKRFSAPAAAVVINGVHYYPVSWAARIVGVSPKTIYGWIAARKLTATKLSKRGLHLDVIGLQKVVQLKGAAAKARRQQDAEGKLMTVSQVIRISRAKDPAEYERLRRRLLRAAEALGIPGLRDASGSRKFTSGEARKLRRAIGVDQEDPDATGLT